MTYVFNITSVHIKKEYTTLQPSYLVTVHLLSKFKLRYNCVRSIISYCIQVFIYK